MLLSRPLRLVRIVRHRHPSCWPKKQIRRRSGHVRKPTQPFLSSATPSRMPLGSPRSTQSQHTEELQITQSFCKAVATESCNAQPQAPAPLANRYSRGEAPGQPLLQQLVIQLGVSGHHLLHRELRLHPRLGRRAHLGRECRIFEKSLRVLGECGSAALGVRPWWPIPASLSHREPPGRAYRQYRWLRRERRVTWPP